MKKILLVEDTVEVQIVVKKTLGKTYHLTVASGVAEALVGTKNEVFDLIIVDIGLPDGDGFHLCSQLKSEEATATIPIIFLTSRSNIEDKLMGFSLGADDYILKPFEPRELKARVEAKLKVQKSDSEIFRKGDLKMNIPFLKAYLVQDDKEVELDLTPNEFRLLYHFATHEGHVLSRQQLLNSIWGQDVSVSERTVDTHVHSLRKKLASHSHYLQSVFGEGYKFVLK